MADRLTRKFYARDTIEVARDLLGRRLVHRLPDGTRLSGVILETEAYLGVEYPCCHTFAGRRTPRTETMYAEAGTSYVYFIYGMYFCFNVVTMARGVPEAVLVRALDLREGVASIHARRPLASAHHLANGPGKLCAALGITRAHDGLDLVSDPTLFIEDDGAVLDADVVCGPRVGLGDKHDAVHWPLRYGLRAHPALSQAKFPPP